MGNEIERRAFTLDKIETRSGNNQPKIIGHAAVFDQLSENLGGFRELIKPGAFANALQQDDIRALHNHDANLVLGRNKAGTLILTEDEKGLAVEINPPDTGFARDLLKSIERGDIDQMSFGFTVRAGGEQWAENENRETIRTLRDLRLFDVSTVVFPAYPQTDAAVRSMAEYKAQHVNQQSKLSQYFRRLRVLELTDG